MPIRDPAAYVVGGVRTRRSGSGGRLLPGVGLALADMAGPPAQANDRSAPAEASPADRLPLLVEIRETGDRDHRVQALNSFAHEF